MCPSRAARRSASSREGSRSPGAGTDAIATLAADPELRARMGAAGRARMQKEFSIATMVDKHVALYESIVDG